MRAEFDKVLLGRAERLIGYGYDDLAVAQALDLDVHRVQRLRSTVRGRLLAPKVVALNAERCPDCGRRVLLPCLACANENLKQNQRLLEA